MHNKFLKFCRQQSSLIRKKYIFPDPNYGFYSILSTSPPIFYVAHWMNEELKFFASLDVLFKLLKYRRAYFLYDWYWRIEEPERVEIVKQSERWHHLKYPRHKFIHLCNTLNQQRIFQQKGLNTVFCNQNCLVDEEIFKPIFSIPKIYDAVYDARLKDYKRHYLASEISSLALIYDSNPVIDNPIEVEQIKQQISHACFFNHVSSSEYKKLAYSEVNQCLNACKVGLCLSQVEGAMYASIQYLLSGLPVVSTKSGGGRDVFFDDEYVLIVEDHPTAVKEGVQEMIRRNIPADSIRQKTIERTQQHRLRLFELIQSIYDQEGVKRNFVDEWDGIFFNTLIKYQNHAEIIQLLKGES